jgi:transposase-like protein
MMAEPGVRVDHATIYRRVQTYAPEMEKRLGWQWRRPTSGSWRVDETCNKVCGKWTCLYRAVDKFRATIDFQLSPTRNTKAVPGQNLTDKAPAHGAAISELKAEGKCPRRNRASPGQLSETSLESTARPVRLHASGRKP